MIKKQKDKSVTQKKNSPYKITQKRFKVTGILFLSAVLIILIFISPLFKIKTVNVTGLIKLSDKDVINTSGVKKGSNIFTINVSEVCRNIEKMDRVESCDIKRTLPGIVTLIVNEKTESGYIKIKNGYAGINETGMVIVKTKKQEAKCPVIKGIKISEPQTNEYIKPEENGGKKKIEILLRLISELKKRDILKEIKEIDISNINNVSFTLVSETLVNLGSDGKENEDKYEYKIAFLKAILEKDYPKSGGIIELADTKNVTGRVTK